MRLENINNAVIIWGPISLESLSGLKKEKDMIIVTENRPYLIGLKYNIPLLKKENIRFIYCNDNTLGFLFYKGKIEKTIIFYKEKKEQGIIGVSGSLYAALLSKLHNIPIEVALQGKGDLERLDKDASTLEGKHFILEEKERNCIIEAKDELIEWGILK